MDRLYGKFKTSNVESLSEYTQPVLSSWYRDVVLGLRSLRKNPVLSLTAVLT
jgi:hypothetical protein